MLKCAKGYPMPNPQLTEKTLDILQAVGALGCPSLPEIQSCCGLPMTTSHRIVQTLVERGFIMRTAKGHYRLGNAVLALSQGISHHGLLSAAARQPVKELSRKVRAHVHVGAMNDDMVTYLVKQTYGKKRLHSAEGAELEAYCSALGKVLLAALPMDALDTYLAGSAFVALTTNTIINADQLRAEIQNTRTRGWSLDREEFAIGLNCMAVPVRDHNGEVVAALSLSILSARGVASDPSVFLSSLFDTASEISRTAFPASLRDMRPAAHVSSAA